eukprot:Hpha_TRINITY_DN16534_c3_g2::TRINITY_DN16534_c3_g2_i1::g.133600::m.133600
MSGGGSVASGASSGGSVGGSSKGSTWSASSAGSRAVSHTWTEEVPMFPLLNQLECVWSSRLSAFGNTLLLLQPLGLVLNTAFSWGYIMKYPNRGLYFLHFPIWDPTYIGDDSREVPSMVFFWAVVVSLTVGLFLLGVLLKTKGEQQLDARAMDALQAGVHVLGSAMYFPVMHMLMVFCICDNDTSKLRAFDRECWGAWHIVHFVVACAGLLIVFLTGLMSSTLLYQQNPSPAKGYPTARAHTHLDFADHLYRTLLVVLYHTLFAYDSKDAFPVVLCVLTFLLMVYSCMLMPYYSLLMLKLRSGTLALTVWASFLAALGPHVSDSYHDDNLSTMALFVGGTLAFLFGTWVSTIRRNAHCKRALAAAANGETMELSRTVRDYKRHGEGFPNNLPLADLVFSLHRGITSEFTSQGTGATSENSRGPQAPQDEMDVDVPFISTVYIPTDVELATRTLREYITLTGQAPTPCMLLYAFRIYTKGMALFVRNALLSLHYSYFMCFFAGGLASPDVPPVVPCVRAALKESEQLMEWEAAFDTLYQAYKLQSICKPIIGMTNDAHRRVTTAANRIHKDILGHMTDFWKRLLGDKVDTLQLASIANKVTERREEGHFQFRKALQHPTQAIIKRYGQFLRQVMLDSDAADMIDLRLAEMQEKRREQRQAASGDVALRAADLGEFQDGELQSRAMKRNFTARNSQREQQSATIALLSRRMNFMFFLVGCALAGFFIFEALQGRDKKHMVDRTAAAGTARAIAAQAGVVVMQIRWEIESPGGSAARVTQLKEHLLGYAHEFVATHNKLTYGTLSTDYDPHRRFFQSDLSEVIDVPAEGVQKRGLMTLWTLGNKFGNVLLDIADPDRTAVELKDLEFVELNLRHTIGPAFNRSMVFYEEAAVQAATRTIWIVAALFVVSLFLVFVVYVTMALNFQKIGAAKLGTLNLFTLIPRVHLEKLHDEAKSRVDQFEAAEDDDTEHQGLESLMPGKQGGEKEGQEEENAHEEEEIMAHTEVKEEEKDPTETEKAGDASEFQDDAAEETNRKRVRIGAQDRSRELGLLVGVCLFFMFLMSATALTFVFVMQADVSDAEDDRSTGERQRDLVYEYYDYVNKLSSESRMFTQFGKAKYLVHWWDILASDRIDAVHQELVSLATERTQLESYVSTRVALDDLIATQRASQILAANGKSAYPDGDLQGVLRDITWNRTGWDFAEFAKYDGFTIRDPLYTLSEKSEDVSETPAKQDQLARYVLYDDQYTADISRATLPLASVKHDTKATYQEELPRNALILFAVQLALWAVTMFAMGKHETMAKHKYLRMSMFALFGLFAASIIVLGLILTEIERVREAVQDKTKVASLKNRTKVSLDTLADNARGYSQFGDKLFYHKYIEALHAAELDRALHETLLLDPEVDHEVYTTTYDSIHSLRNMERTALFLSASSFGVPLVGVNASRSDEFSFLYGHRYNLSSEQGSSWKIALYKDSTDSLMYSNDADDISLPSSKREQVARYTISGDPYDSDYNSVTKTLTAEADDAFKRADKRVTDSESVLFWLSVAGVIVSVLTMCALLAVSVFATIQLLQMLSGKGRHDALFGELTQRCRVALLFVALLLALLFSVTFINHASTKSIVPNGNLASAREWLLADSFFLLEKLFLPNVPNHERFLASRRISLARHLIEDNRNDLYFGKEGGGYNLPGNNRAQDEMIFGPAQGDGLDSHSCPNRGTDEPMSFLLEYGNDLGIHAWTQILSDFSTIAIEDHQRAIGQKDKLIAFEHALFNALRNSTDLHATHGKDKIDQASLIFFLLLSVIVVVVLLEYIFIFRPMVRMLRKEEEGTNLMLQMIPKEIQETVPAIAEYLTTGVITQNEKVQEVDAAMVEFSAVPTVTIDKSGSIVQFSRAAVEQFGFSVEEALGKNVKMLMQEQDAARHDSYLAAYERTGIKRLIDKSRRVMAQRKDGTAFPVEVCIHELRRSGMDPLFIGRLRDVQQDLMLENERAIGNAVIELSSVPIVMIDIYGTITKFSRAAEEVFGHNGDELIAEGANVKVLQPKNVADEHDGYLARYRRTRRKVILDTNRKIRGKRADSTEFEADVCVKEFFDATGQSMGYGGYIRDCTEENQLQFTVSVSDAIVRISPVPMLSITPLGIVRWFSPAAERDWLISASEIIGKNIKMLMPEDIARAHDGHLARYLRTGEKRVINNVRVVQGKRANGQVFPCEVSVREVKQGTEQSAEAFYVGYVRDVSQERTIVHRARVRKTVIELSPLPIAIMNEIGTVQSFNQSACEMFGFEKDEMIGQNIKVIQAPEIATHHDSYLANYLATGMKHVVDTTRRVTGKRKSGSPVGIEIKVAEIVVSSTERTYIGYMRDCADELRMLSANLINDVVTELSVSPIIAINDVGEIITFSRSAAVQFGWAVDEIMNKNVKLLMPPEAAAIHQYKLSEYKRSRKKKVIDNVRRITAMKKDGEEFLCESLVREIKQEGADAIYIGSIRDLTDELATLERQRLNETIINMSSVPFIAITQRGLIQMWNPAAQKTFGFSTEEVMGKNVKLLMPEEVARFHDGYLREYVKSGKGKLIGQKREMLGKTKDDRPVPIEIHVEELRLGTLKWFGAFARDCTYQHSLKHSSDVKDAVIELNPVPIITIDAFGKILAFTSSAEHELLVPKQEAIGANVKTIMPPHFAEKHDGFLKSYRKTGVKKVIDTVREVAAQRKDGTQYPAEISVRAVKDGQEEIYIGYLRNITNQKQIQEKQREGKMMVDLALTGFITIDQKGYIKMWSKVASDIWGYTEEEMLGQKIEKAMPEEYAVKHDSFLERYITTRVKRVVDSSRRVVGKMKDGGTFPMHLSLREYRDSSGSTFIGQVRDMRAEFELYQEQALGAAIAESNVTPIVAIDDNGIVLRFNKAASDAFGWSRQEVTGQNVKILQPPNIAAQHDGYLQSYKVTGIKRIIDTVREVTGKRRDGTEFPCEVTVRELKQEMGATTFIGYISSLEGRNATKRATEVAEETLDLCVLAVVTIQEKGTVQRFNKAAEDLFGYKRTEVCGQNVKMLTPENVEAVHDQFLENYHQTGVKHVIDSGRRVLAKRKDKTTVPVEIYVKELVTGADKRIYIGYLRNLTEEFMLQQAYVINDMVTSLTTVPMIAIDAIGSILKFSPAAEAAFKWPLDEILQKNIKTLMSDEVASRHDMYLKRYAETGEAKVIGTVSRQQAKRRDGTMFNVELQVKELKGDGDEGSTFVAFARDVTADDTVARTCAVNEMLINVSPVSIIRATTVGEILIFNKAATELFGYPEDVAVGSNLKILMPYSISKDHDMFLKRYLETGKKYVIDTSRRVPARRRDGTELEVEIMVREVRQRGKDSQYVAYLQDISHKLELEKLKKLNDAVLDLAAVPVVVIDHRGIIQRFTPAAEKVFGWTQSELFGKNVQILMPKEAAVGHDKKLERFQKTRVKTVIDTMSKQHAVHKDGHEFPVTLNVRVVMTDGENDVYIGFLHQ